MFAKGGIGQLELKRVLMTFSKYDINLGYVQGMNFIIGALLYHCPEDVAFWLFVSLIEDHEMREVYLTNFPGLHKHTRIIDVLLFDNCGTLYQHFVRV